MRDVLQKGFTLVELAIALTIIGLLIGGVLKGQELINNARATRFINDLKQYETAIHTFRDKFDGLPGDYRKASERVRGCTGANFCGDGSGNNIVGIDNPPMVGLATITWAGRSTNIETSMLWKHLALEDLISGVDVGVDLVVPAHGGTGVPTWGKTHPVGSFPGGFEAFSVTPFSDLLLRFQGQVGNNILPFQHRTLPVKYTANIDRKMDDGSCVDGQFQAVCMDGVVSCSHALAAVPFGSLYEAVDQEDGTCLALYSLSPVGNVN